ncbi:MAG TPA: homoserine dehydrogenase [Acidimicrobiales bacterium]|jgi:homoserine dehydrogenase|nr:homoserine dehydrogenase [Acidimicrobiales bacterium]
MTPIRVGVLGCGNVGAALCQLLLGDAERIEVRTGIPLALARVAVHSLARERPVQLPPGMLTNDAQAVVNDPDIDVVVEVIGGIEPARGLILQALKGGKPVVTANKELLANVGSELFEAASAGGVDLLFEAAVAGGIPLIRPLRESLAGEGIRRIMGIVNGTTNFVLTKMAEGGASYHDALAEAQRLGYAERDPTADVEGYDAAAKAAILANVAFGVRVVAGDVYREGISAVTTDDIAFANQLGYVIKLLAIIEQVGDMVAVRVHPAMVPAAHPLAAVRDSFNAVFVEGESVGELMFLGRGAGGMPTASAVLGDLLDAAHNLSAGGAGRTMSLRPASIFPVDELRSEYYLSIDVADKPGVLHAVAGVLGDHDVSIRLMEQVGLGAEARLVIILHPALERDVQACLRDLRQLDVVDRTGGLLRVIADRA